MDQQLDVGLQREAAEAEQKYTPTQIGKAIHEWARTHGALVASEPVESDMKLPLSEIYGVDDETAERIANTLRRIKVVCVAADSAASSISVMCKGAISSAAEKRLPKNTRGITIHYTGKTLIEPNPPAAPSSAVSGAPIWFSHNNRISCGSSVICSHTPGAGTLGFLATMADGRIVGFSNNHVTGDSNHTPAGMHILSPAPIDASPASPPPLAIGKHLSLAQLNSGDPQQIALQEIDGAIFEITEPDKVSSMQGNGAYDTPSVIAPMRAGMVVKKVGRTTGLRLGTVLGETVIPLSIPYKSSRFQSMVYFTGVWIVEGANGNTFSEGGDSGSLVVTADGTAAVGVVFAGGNNVSFVLPIAKVLNFFSLSLLSSHNVEPGNGQPPISASIAPAP